MNPVFVITLFLVFIAVGFFLAMAVHPLGRLFLAIGVTGFRVYVLWILPRGKGPR
ncbi:MAG TPA: hypothetical protein VMT00_04330 [Thermoanaerobaculia bacterium]|nr:hypothetical protein [Thermoanaerobaculia bacterium]